MNDQWVQEFIDALHGLEDGGDVGPLLAQFAPDAGVWNVALHEPLRGEAGAHRFWEGYRQQFDRIHSTFEKVIVGADEAALEWHAEGTLAQPPSGWMQSGGRMGRHSEHLGHLLSEMQFLQRADPGATW